MRWDAQCCSGIWNLFVSVRSGFLVELVVFFLLGMKMGAVLWNARRAGVSTELRTGPEQTGNEVNDGGAWVACSSLACLTSHDQTVLTELPGAVAMETSAR